MSEGEYFLPCSQHCGWLNHSSTNRVDSFVLTWQGARAAFLKLQLVGSGTALPITEVPFPFLFVIKLLKSVDQSGHTLYFRHICKRAEVSTTVPGISKQFLGCHQVSSCPPKNMAKSRAHTVYGTQIDGNSEPNPDKEI